MKNLELESFGLVEMKSDEMLLIDGGKGSIWFELAKDLIDHWDEFKDGVKRGWNDFK